MLASGDALPVWGRLRDAEGEWACLLFRLETLS